MRRGQRDLDRRRAFGEPGASRGLSVNQRKELTAEIERGRVPLTITIKPVMIETDIPIGFVMTLSRRAGDILAQSFHYPISVVRSTFRAFGLMIAGKIAVRDSVAGPIAIVSMAANTVRQGRTPAETLAGLGTLLGLLSVAVGFTNMLPIPPLDGNHLILIGVEAIRRKPLSRKFRSVTGMIGLAFSDRRRRRLRSISSGCLAGEEYERCEG